MIKIGWTEFKAIYNSRNMDLILVEDERSYSIYGIEASFTINCLIFKDDSSEHLEFEEYYLPHCNLKRQTYDPSGKPYARFAIAKEGNLLQCFAFTFTLSKLNSLHCKSPDNSTDKNFITYKMFKSNGDETLIDAECVHTRLEFEPNYDYELAGGQIWQKVQSTTPIKAYLTAVPDIPAIAGGSKEMCTGGFDVSFLGPNQTYAIDGRAPKELIYNPTYHTNKLRLDFYHIEGHQHELMFKIEMYK
jgi:hypothetical protein